MIETKQNIIDIKELTLSDPVRGVDLSFDPAIDLTREQENAIGEAMVQEMYDLRETGRPDRVDFKFLRAVGILSPKIQQFMDDETWRQMRRAIVIEGDNFETGEIFNIAATAKIISSEYAKQDQLISSDLWGSIKSSINAENPYAELVFPDLANIRIIAPEKMNDFEITDDVMEDARKRIGRYKSVSQWPNCAQFLSDIKIASPEKIGELGIEQWMWERIFQDTKTALNEYPAKGMGSDTSPKFIAKHAVHLAILSAEDVKVTDDGVELIMPTKTQSFSEKNSVPVRRRF